MSIEELHGKPDKSGHNMLWLCQNKEKLYQAFVKDTSSHKYCRFQQRKDGVFQVLTIDMCRLHHFPDANESKSR